MAHLVCQNLTQNTLGSGGTVFCFFDLGQIVYQGPVTTDAKENKDDFDFFFNRKESSINAVFICAGFYNTKDEYSKKVLVGFSMKNKI